MTDRQLEQNSQSGFSLLEVLLAMFIAAVALSGLVLLHARSIAQINDNASLMRVQRILNNAAANAPTMANVQNLMEIQATAQGLRSVIVTDQSAIVGGLSGRILSLAWANNDPTAAVWRCPNIRQVTEAGRSCLQLWVLP